MLSFVIHKKILVLNRHVDKVYGVFTVNMATRKQIRRAIRRPLETAGFMTLQALIPLLPRGGIVGLATFLGATAMLFPLPEKKHALTNLNAVYGESKSMKEKKRIAATSLATFAQTMLDVFWFSHRPEHRIRKYVEFEPGPNCDSFFENKAVICITAHMGSWEVMGQAAALHGADMASIAATIKNKSVNRAIIRHRERTGQTIIPQKGALKTLIARFRKKGKAAFVLDQHTGRDEGGIVVDFLGMPMSVSSAPAALAYRTGTDIMLGFCLPQPGGRYLIRIPKIITPPRFDKNKKMDAIVHDLTQQIEDGVSEQILRFPQYWLWSYKHWRRREGYPYPDHFPTY